MSMRKKKQAPLTVSAEITDDGIAIIVDGKKYRIRYPKHIWDKTSSVIKKFLKDNLVFGNTIYLGPMLSKTKIEYETRQPLFETELLTQNIYDMRDCEVTDGVPALTYLSLLYNTEYDFADGSSILPRPSPKPSKTRDENMAIIPFSFGKESLLTYAICKELGIVPILVMSQEPTQTYEESYKKVQFQEFLNKYNEQGYYIVNEPGLFRHGKAFNTRVGTELGWGGQTMLLSLMSVPMIFFHNANYILYGSEHSNNDWEMRDGWKVFCSYDQMSNTTPHQDNIIRIVTGDTCRVKSIFEALEELHIFYILHHRYPYLSKEHFSCTAFRPLVDGSQWCHQCDKCERNFIFARACNIDPYTIGFKYDLLEDSSRYKEYFDVAYEYDYDLDMAFYILWHRGDNSSIVQRFAKQKMNSLQPWHWYENYYSSLKKTKNMPEKDGQKILDLFTKVLKDFRSILPKSI